MDKTIEKCVFKYALSHFFKNKTINNLILKYIQENIQVMLVMAAINFPF